ncbi:hypothetical protein ccbrp13_20210 [Ktedonobacteria bacterium brp13]|nr:hypothetical protein ccbrp13_20210 [Ktedonobacteria bacterium brp13]
MAQAGDEYLFARRARLVTLPVQLAPHTKLRTNVSFSHNRDASKCSSKLYVGPQLGIT